MVVLAVGGYFFFTYWSTSHQTAVWDLIPESAILVYESTQTVENWNEIQSKPVWENLENIPYYASIRDNIDQLDSLTGKKGRLHQLLQSKPFVFSVHKVSQHSLDYLFFIPLPGPKDRQLISSMISQYQNRDDYKFQTRTYQDFLINEAINQEYEEVFSYLFHKDYFIGSFTPFLLEDVIRNLSGQTDGRFISSNQGLMEVAKLENDQGNIYISSSKIPQLISVFTDEKTSGEFNISGVLAESAFLDLKVTEDQVLLNGFTIAEQSGRPFLSSVQGGQGSSIGFKSILPNDVAVLFHVTFQDATLWHQRLRSFWEQHNQMQLTQWSDLSRQFQWDPTEMVSLQQQEIGLVTLSTIEDEKPEKILYLRFSDNEKALNQLNGIASKAAEANGEPVYIEPYATKEIVQINLEEFPSRVWGNVFKGFERSFFIPVNDYLIVANSISALKGLHQSIEREETWGKSIIMNEFLGSALQEANLSLIVNLSQAWNLINSKLSSRWRSFFELNKETLSKFELGAIQFSDIGDKFYTSGVLTLAQSNNNQQPAPSFQSKQQVFTQAPIISKPHVVRNHNNGAREVLLQDSLKSLYLIGSQGRMLWQDSLGGRIRGVVSQIDYYSNNKLQYLLATDQKIHIIDRNGNPVEGFPVSIPTQTRLRNVGVLDYDGSKRYRFIASDESGQVFMLDKQGKLLEGWNPKVLQDQLLFAPQHIRIRNKDCIIAIQENGMVNVMNRRGDAYSGFPLDMGGATSGPLFIQTGTDFSNTVFTGVTSNGLIVKFDLNGKVAGKQQLVKPTRDTYYQLCMDPMMRYFIIKRQNANRLGILNRKGEILFEKDYLSTSDLKVQYYLLSNNHSVYAVTDPVQQFTYFYNEDGTLINASPIESNSEIAMLYFENQNQHQVYSVYDNKFALVAF
ncbi:MAG: hypothetical protein DHS20C17_02520 [Cyclobacteriaceae bacterium]|nr:MAG: hypothetical protein DHS20C17_02520 [Cyclobacteriaceae bacterium]